jgi:hypothetical protein
MYQVTSDKLNRVLFPSCLLPLKLEKIELKGNFLSIMTQCIHLSHSLFCGLHTFLITREGLTFDSWSPVACLTVKEVILLLLLPLLSISCSLHFVHWGIKLLSSYSSAAPEVTLSDLGVHTAVHLILKECLCHLHPLSYFLKSAFFLCNLSSAPANSPTLVALKTVSSWHLPSYLTIAFSSDSFTAVIWPY